MGKKEQLSLFAVAAAAIQGGISYTAPELFNLKRLAGHFKYELGFELSKPIIALKKRGLYRIIQYKPRIDANPSCAIRDKIRISVQHLVHGIGRG